MNENTYEINVKKGHSKRTADHLPRYSLFPINDSFGLRWNIYASTLNTYQLHITVNSLGLYKGGDIFKTSL